MKNINDLQFITEPPFNKSEILDIKNYLNCISTINGFLVSNATQVYIPIIISKNLIFKYAQFLSDFKSLNSTTVSPLIKLSFLNYAVNFCKSNLKVDYISQSPPHVIFEIPPNSSLFCKFGTYKINLKKNEIELWNNVHSKHKNVIRNANNSGIQIKIGEEYLFFALDLINETLKRSKLSPVSKDIVLRFNNNITNCIIPFVAFKENIIQGCAIFICLNDTVYYMWGGSIAKPSLGSMNLLHWNAILYFKNLNFTYYDFVGGRVFPEPNSKLEGIQRFKSRFGSSFEIGYLWKTEFSLKYKLLSPIFNLLKRYVFKKNTFDIIDQEIRKYG